MRRAHTWRRRGRALVALAAILGLGPSACVSRDPGEPRSRRERLEQEIATLRESAEQGDVAAQRELAARYESGGRGVRKSEANAVEWYRRAAAAGDAEAMTAMGLRYQAGGRVVKKDQAEAVRLYRAAAELGDSKAQEQLGLLYFRGQGVPRDFVESHFWLNLSSQAGSATARGFLPVVEQQLSRRQLAEAERRAEEWLDARPASKPPPVPP